MIKTLKKIIVLLVTVAMLFTLVGCGGTTGEDSGDTSELETEQGVEDPGTGSADNLNDEAATD